MNAYYILSTISCAGDNSSKQIKNSVPHRAYMLVEETDNKQDK